MMRCVINKGFGIVLLLSLLWGCQPSRPKGILMPDQLEEVLHDYHLAQAMVYTNRMGAQDKDMDVAIESALQKHGVTQEELDSSMSYYSHHVEVLNEIYLHLNDRFTDEAKLLGIQHSRPNDMEFSESGDTVNIWQEKPFLLLTAAPLDCTRIFTFEADSSYHPRDRFVLKGNTRVLGNGNQRTGVVIGMMVTYDNDSIQTQSRTITNNQDFSIDLRCDTFSVRRLNCYMTMFNDTPNPLILDNLQLLKMHR